MLSQATVYSSGRSTPLVGLSLAAQSQDWNTFCTVARSVDAEPGAAVFSEDGDADAEGVGDGAVLALGVGLGVGDVDAFSSAGVTASPELFFFFVPLGFFVADLDGVGV